MAGSANRSDDFWFHQAEAPSGYHLVLGGRFTFRCHDAFSDVLAIIAWHGAADGLIDLSAVTFMDSSALWMLQVARDEAAGRGGALLIQGAGGEVRELLRLTRLDAPYRTDGRPQPAFLVADGQPWPQGSRPLLHAEASPDLLSKGLSAPYCGFIEGDKMPGARCLRAVQMGGLALSVSTGTACGMEVVQPFAEALQKTLGEADMSLVELCLAEAVGNAAIHGNLGIDGSLRSTRVGFEVFSQQMTARLLDPVMASRRIDVTMTPLDGALFRLSVSDRGAGFDIEATREIVAGPDAKHGRGLSLIRQIAKEVYTEDGGRTLIMDFAQG